MNLHPLPSARPAHHIGPAGELDKMAELSFSSRENREGHGEAPRASAPSSERSSPRPRTPWSSSSSSSSSSRPPSSCSRWRCAAAAWQAALHLRVHASCPGFLHVLAALDEAAALVIVLRVCDSLRVTLGVSLCGWHPGQPGRSESKYFWSVTFHRLYVMCGRVLACPETSLGRVRLHEDQDDLWRKQL